MNKEIWEYLLENGVDGMGIWLLVVVMFLFSGVVYITVMSFENLFKEELKNKIAILISVLLLFGMMWWFYSEGERSYEKGVEEDKLLGELQTEVEANTLKVIDKVEGEYDRYVIQLDQYVYEVKIKDGNLTYQKVDYKALGGK